MYVFLTKQLSMAMDDFAENFTNRFVSQSYTVVLMITCWLASLANVSRRCSKGRPTSLQCHIEIRKVKRQSCWFRCVWVVSGR